MKLYTRVKWSPRARESNTVRKARSTMVRRACFTIYLTIYFQYVCSLFLFSFVTNKGMDVAGVPLFCATFSFGFWELLLATGFTFIWRAAVAEMWFLFWFWGV